MKHTPQEKKQWLSPQLVLISTREIENKSHNTYHEKTFIKSTHSSPAPGFNILHFTKNPTGIVAPFTEMFFS